MNPKLQPDKHLSAELAASLDQLDASQVPTEAQEQAFKRLTSSLDAARQQVLRYTRFEHNLTGPVFAMLHGDKLVRLDFGIPESEFLARVHKQFGEQPYLVSGQLTSIEIQLCDYLDGHRLDFEIETDLSLLTDFQRRVLAATSLVPRGRVVTYLDIARQIDSPKAARAVGQALGRNPLPIVIPCHRVVATNGSLSGYSGGGGLVTKARLLALEGVSL